MTQKSQPTSNQDSGGTKFSFFSPGWRQLVWIFVIILFSSYWFGQAQMSHYETLSYSQFKERVRNNEIARVTLKGQTVTGIFKTDNAQLDAQGARPANAFFATLPSADDPELILLLEAHQVDISAETTQTSSWQTLLVSFLPLLLIFGFFYYSSQTLRKRLGGGDLGVFNYGKSKARRFRKGSINLSFADVAGLENAKRDLHEIIDFLKQPEDYLRVGAKIPRGVLLMGPPGTGKTLLAKAVAGEAEVPFYSISGSEFIEMFVGVGASRVRDMFEAAKKESPAIIFIDEIDSVGRTRGSGVGGGHDEREQTLNQILSEMDGFAAEHTVVVIAATNRPDVLDPALLRPGRFDRKITLELPLKDARRKVLEVHSRDVPLADDVDLESLAARTAGFSGADLENLINEAALLTGREKKDQVTAAILDKARDKIVLGAERDNILNDKEKERVAFHEAGHALMACLLDHADPVSKVTIIPRGRSLGVTEQLPEEERANLPQSYLLDRIAVMLGGRVAEKLVFDEFSSGAEEDIKQATRLARHMVSQWGMSKKLGPVAFRRGEEHIFLGREMAQQRDFSEHTARLIDDEVRSMVCNQEQTTHEILMKNRNALDKLAHALLEKEILDAKEVLEIIQPEILETQ